MTAEKNKKSKGVKTGGTHKSPKGQRANRKDGSAEVIEPEVLGPETSSETEARDDEILELAPSPAEPEAIGEFDGIEVLPAEAEHEEEDAPPDSEHLPARGKRRAGASEGRSKDLIPYDPLNAYLREISRYRPLTVEEEQELAQRYIKNKDIEAAYGLVSGNLWLVVKIAREYQRAARNLMDLIQEGNIGLMEAVKNFDPYRGVRFPSYAVWWIRAYIIRFVIANWRLVKIGTTQAQRKLFFNLNKEKERLAREGFTPAPKLIAENLNVRESDVIEMEQRLGSGDVSVDAPLQDDSDGTLLGVLPNQQESAEDLLGRKELHEQLLETLDSFEKGLSDKERAIFRERMLGEEKATLGDLAERFDLSKERIRQIENRLRERLKDFLVEKMGAAVEHLQVDS